MRYVRIIHFAQANFAEHQIFRLKDRRLVLYASTKSQHADKIDHATFVTAQDVVIRSSAANDSLSSRSSVFKPLVCVSNAVGEQ